MCFISLCVCACDMWGSPQHGALGRKPSCSGLGEVLTKEVYGLQSHYICFQKLLGNPLILQKAFSQMAWEAGIQGDSLRRVCSLVAGCSRGQRCRHGWGQEEGKASCGGVTLFWEGFHKNKLWTRLVIVQMDVSRFKQFGMFHEVFFSSSVSGRILQITRQLSQHLWRLRLRNGMLPRTPFQLLQ